MQLTYGGRTRITGEALQKWFDENESLTSNIHVCWGYGSHGINANHSNAGNKLTMALRLHSIMPYITFFNGISGRFHSREFIRNKYHHVVYRSRIKNTDLYSTETINKAHEYRVHIVGDKCIGIYEKIPHDGIGTIRKAENCDFKRIDRGEIDCSKIMEIAKKAVELLELDFGGVDVLEDVEGTLYVNEVNSAPSLNTPNIERWGMALIKLAQEMGI